MTKRLLSIAAITSSLLGCGAGEWEDTEATSEGQLAKAQSGVIDVNDISPTIDHLEHTGTLCPAGSVVFSPNAGSFGALFESAAITSHESRSAMGSCRIDFDVLLPAGVKLTRASFKLAGAGYVRDGGRADLSARYAVNGGAFVSGATRTITPSDDDWNLEDRSDLVASACGSTGPTRVHYAVELSTRASDVAWINITQISGGFMYRDGARYTACPGVTLDERGAAAEGEECGTEAEIACESPLRCDVRATTRGEGVCVDEKKPVGRRSAVGGDCGGVHAIACEPGSVCHYRVESHASEQRLSTCAATTGTQVGAACGGFPAIPCQSGLACIKEQCAPVGRHDDPCNPQSSECGPGLSCNQVGAGHRCGRNPFIGDACNELDQCSTGLACNTKTNTCSVLNPGQQDSRCRPGIDACNAGLVCKKNRQCGRPE